MFDLTKLVSRHDRLLLRRAAKLLTHGDEYDAYFYAQLVEATGCRSDIIAIGDDYCFVHANKASKTTLVDCVERSAR